jgi:hypothetical protein
MPGPDVDTKALEIRPSKSSTRSERREKVTYRIVFRLKLTSWPAERAIGRALATNRWSPYGFSDTSRRRLALEWEGKA